MLVAHSNTLKRRFWHISEDEGTYYLFMKYRSGERWFWRQTIFPTLLEALQYALRESADHS